MNFKIYMKMPKSKCVCQSRKLQVVVPMNQVGVAKILLFLCLS